MDIISCLCFLNKTHLNVQDIDKNIDLVLFSHILKDLMYNNGFGCKSNFSEQKESHFHTGDAWQMYSEVLGTQYHCLSCLKPHDLNLKAEIKRTRIHTANSQTFEHPHLKENEMSALQ